MEAFKFSKYFSITDINEDTTIPEKFRDGHYLLSDKARDRDFLINGTIKYFIDKFSSPKTLNQLIKEVEVELGSENDELVKTCTSFFQFLCEKNILIPSVKNEDEEVGMVSTLLKAGDHFENFVIERLLSDRGTLEIYLATDEQTGLLSVIKLLNSNKTYNEEHYNEEFIELEREFSMLQSLQHIPIMCKAFGFKKEEFYAYINLEYIKGVSLTKFLKSTEGLTLNDCKKIIHVFLAGFSAMHNSGIVHGDIHASNILVEDAGNVRIIDFGYSRKSDVEQNEVLPFGGVLHYMPPERINKSSIQKFAYDADVYSDVYQAGVLMYLVFYRTFPFDGFVWEELADNIKETKELYPEISFFNEPVPKKILELIEKCLAKNPADRYNNAEEILNDFLKYAFEKEPIAN